MDLETYPQPNWAEAAFAVFNNTSTCHQQGKWSEFGGSSDQNFSITPYLLTQSSSEQSDQCSQYEEPSHPELCPEPFRDASIPVEVLRDETLWHQLQSNSFQQQQKASLGYRNTEQENTKYHDARSQVENELIETNNDAPQSVTNSQPFKRKRGRPRLKSPIIEAHDFDVSTHQLSSARKTHLEKNRIAASKCRQRKKEYVDTLIADASELSLRNKVLKADETKLREQVLNLKNEVLRHAGCGSWAIDRYVERCAGDLVGVGASSFQESEPRKSSPFRRLATFPDIAEEFASGTIVDSLFSQESTEYSTDSNEYNNIRFLNDYEDMEDK